MLSDMLPYEEQHALETILSHHEVDNPQLTKDLAMFCNWVREDEKDKGRFGAPQAPFLLVLLGQMGIYAKRLKARSASD